LSRDVKFDTRPGIQLFGNDVLRFGAAIYAVEDLRRLLDEKSDACRLPEAKIAGSVQQVFFTDSFSKGLVLVARPVSYTTCLWRLITFFICLSTRSFYSRIVRKEASHLKPSQPM
jgi:hypothetical protein